ncbi:hypothetical protein EVG20_g5447 [Dentipellis fragilis]|uniref:N-acetyltransferase domain-containing protein n=1 Tax=Dentipellis fragilis TaxID=205917 RepID=A0A4Y9YV95_9AGAM|nr:hypothetical protein EVG20_g5447 [Dentipellis fragilis]
MTLTIRPATAADSPALSRICLVTGDVGASAEPLHTHGELPGLVWALPYVHIPDVTWGFVVVDDSAPDDHSTAAVKGYILGASDTRAFEAKAEETWWPPLRAKYPLDPPAAQSEARKRTDADNNYVKILHSAPAPASEACLAWSPAHMHVDLLPELQRQGWGRKLVDVAVKELTARGVDSLWLGMDPRNESARQFYVRLGFEPIDGAPASYMGLRFKNWKGV